MNTAKWIGCFAILLGVMDLLKFFVPDSFYYANNAVYYFTQMEVLHLELFFISYILDALFDQSFLNHYLIDVLLGILLVGTGIVYLIRLKGLRVIAFIIALIFVQQSAHGTLILFSNVLRISDGFLPVPFIMIVILGAAACYVLLLFKKEEAPLLSSTKRVATRIERFWGYSIDLLIMIFVMWQRWIYVADTLWGRLLLILSIVTYYFVFERVFQFTPGKIVMNTRVETENGRIPDERAMFIRSFSRVIPLEAFSFLFAGKGWHDAFSRTQVVKYVKNKN